MADHVPNLVMNEIRKSKALGRNPVISELSSSQDGTGYARIAMPGPLDGEAVNYDGQTDIPATSTNTYEQGVVVVGRAKAWTEKDFSFDITGGIDFMQNIANQVAEYKNTLDQNSLLAVLEGIFSMSGEQNEEFVEKHTHDITEEGGGAMTPVTLNTAANKACGANKKKFTLVFMHSDVATGLENLDLLEHLKYTDAEGITRDLDLGTWNGKLVVIDDNLPVKEILTSGGDEVYTQYTTYVLGDGAISFEDLGAKRAYEMDRNPAKNGGEDTLYMRQRKVFAPYGISYEKLNQASLSPTEGELADGENWTLVHTGEANETERTYINHKAIPIARIISKG
ncbi:MAG: phage coat protein [Oscillospiraceae bacterium]|nr:phage coat protein [Oscillospiraceae bacterium]